MRYTFRTIRVFLSGTLVIGLLSIPATAQSSNPKKMWVKSDRVERRTCPSEKCGVVGSLFFRESAKIFEVRGKWARVSRYYDAACSNGKSKYIDSGTTECVSSNGIDNGKFAEWALLTSLSEKRPPDPAKGATGIAKLIGDSDDFRIYKHAFVKITAELLRSKQCSENDFKEFGGWVKSTNHRSKPIYFVYCGGMHASNRIYLDANTGKTFR